jgi:hypothetical protein
MLSATSSEHRHHCFHRCTPSPVAGKRRSPAGVAKNRWVRLGDSAGVVVTSRPAQGNGKTSSEAKCELWLKLDGNWSPRFWSNRNNFFQPAR